MVAAPSWHRNVPRNDVEATKQKDGDHYERYDDWRGSGKVCLSIARDIDARAAEVSQEAIAAKFF